MDIFISSLVSILATVIVGWFFFWKQRVKSVITHFSISSYDIGKGLSEMFPEFQLQYNGNNLVGEVKVLKGYIVNSGNKDVAELDKKPIQLLLPDGCKVKAINVLFESKDLEVNPAIGDSKIDFMVSDGVLKTNDIFEYTAIIETPKGIELLQDGLKLGPRRENLDYNYMSNETLGKSSFSKWRLYIIISLFTAFVYFFMSWYMSIVLNPVNSCKVIENKTNKEFFIYASPQGEFYLVDEEHDLSLSSKHKITEEELSNNYTFKPEIVDNTKLRTDTPSYKTYLYLATGLLCFLGVVLLSDRQFLGRKERHITRIIRKNKGMDK